jgi:2-amino-4-hydroxy-6-hydroxymethyldihydropteridine diphosphokinase
MVRAFVAVGSNIDPMANVQKALRRLSDEVKMVAISTFYLTEPIGLPESPSFINGVVELETEIPPHELKYELLRKVERELGRKRTADKNAPRPIDLDLLVYGDESIHAGDLTVPDPEITSRPFLAIPLGELAPELILVGTDTPVQKIASAFGSPRMKRLEKFSETIRRETLK